MINQIILGNCLEILKTIPSDSIDLVLTDPPYNISSDLKITMSNHPNISNKQERTLTYAFGDWDVFDSEKSHMDFTKQWMEECYRVLTPQGNFVTFFANWLTGDIKRIWEGFGGRARQKIYWKKLNPKPRLRKCLTSDSTLLTPYGLRRVFDYEGSLITDNGNMIGTRTNRIYEGDILDIYPYGIVIPLSITPDHLVLSTKIQYCSLPTYKNKKCLPKFMCGCGYSPCSNRESIGKKNTLCENRYSNYKLEWTSSKNLSIGDYVVFPRKYEIKKINSIPIEYFKRGSHVQKTHFDVPINSDIMRLLGFYLSEGCIIENGNYVGFYFSLKEEEYCLEIKQIIEKYFDASPRINKLEWKYEVRIDNAKLKMFLDKCGGHGALNKVISQEILSQPLELLYDLLWSYWQGDGCYYESKKDIVAIFSTISPNLAGQVFIILVRLGYSPSINTRKPYEGKITGKHLLYEIKIRGIDQVNRFVNKKIIKNYFNHRTFVDEKYVYIPIRKIEKRHINDVVYDYSTNGNFLTTGGIVHNCDLQHAIEEIFWGTKSDSGHIFNYLLGQHHNIIESAVLYNTEATGHPTQKPEKVVEWIIDYLSNKNSTVLDPFCGSGTIPFCAYKHGRNYIGIEQDQKYVEISNNRINKLKSHKIQQIQNTSQI